MSRLERPDRIERLVGARRSQTDHIARAVSAEQRVYILHSVECAARGIDLRSCEFSESLDLGIDIEVWGEFQDQPVVVVIDAADGVLTPLPPNATNPAREAQR